MHELLPILELFQGSAKDIMLAIVLLTLPILPNLWSIWDAYRHEFDTPAEKYGWMCGGIFLPVIGGMLYLLVGRLRKRGLSEWAR